MTSGAQLLNNSEEYSRCIIPTLNAGRPGAKTPGEKRHKTPSNHELGQDLKRKWSDGRTETHRAIENPSKRKKPEQQ